MSLIQQNMGAIYDGSQRLIAPVLNSTTATQNWAVGQEFILDGNLYKVTTAIPSGSQIIVSGSSANCELADTVTEQIRLKSVASYNVTTSNTYRGAANLVALQLNADEVIKHWNTLKLRVGNYIGDCVEVRSDTIVFSINIVGTYNLLYVIRMKFDGVNSIVYSSTDGGSPTEISTSNVTSLLADKWEVFY